MKGPRRYKNSGALLLETLTFCDSHFTGGKIRRRPFAARGIAGWQAEAGDPSQPPYIASL